MTAAPAARADAVRAMLGATSIAVVGASARPDSFGARLVAESLRGSASRQVSFVNPRWDEIAGRRCVPSLDELDHAPDLVLLGVGDHAVADQLAGAAARGARSAVVFGSLHAPGIREQVTTIANDAGMALCGGGCMGFVHTARELRAIGYVEPDPVAAGPISVITHSGSVFSALLRTRRALGYTLAVSSGQELVTTTADYLDYVLHDTDTALIGLVLETARDGHRLRAALRRAADRDIPVVLLPVGGTPRGAAMVAAHSGAVAGEHATWEALCRDTGARRVDDLAEFTDTLELLALTRGRRIRPAGGLAAVHDSGAERTLLVDHAERLGVRLATITEPTRATLALTLDDGLDADNPLDVWGTGAETRKLFATCLQTMAGDPDVGAVVLSVDLVPEFDGDTAYPDAVLDAAAATDVPVAVLSNLAAAIDDATATRLRAAGVAVLEGTRSGLVALRHLLQPSPAASHAAAGIDPERQRRWRERLAEPGALSAVEGVTLLADYGVPTVATGAVESAAAAVRVAGMIGFPVVLKAGASGLAHKTEVDGVRLGLGDAAAVEHAFDDLQERLGLPVLVCAQAESGVEMSLGLIADAALGPMVVLAAGGVLVELLADRAVALPPLNPEQAGKLLAGLRVDALLRGYRTGRQLDRDAVVAAVCGMAQLALEIGDVITAVDVNPLIVSASTAVAVDVLVVR